MYPGAPRAIDAGWTDAVLAPARDIAPSCEIFPKGSRSDFTAR